MKGAEFVLKRGFRRVYKQGGPFIPGGGAYNWIYYFVYNNNNNNNNFIYPWLKVITRLSELLQNCNLCN